MYQEDDILWNNPTMNPNRPSVNMSYALGLAQGTILKIFENEFPEDHFECIDTEENFDTATEHFSEVRHITERKRFLRGPTQHQEPLIGIKATSVEIVVSILEPRLQESTLFVCKVMYFLGDALGHYRYPYRINPDTIKATGDLRPDARSAPLIPVWK